MAGLEDALKRALSIRLHYQIGLSSVPAVEEWMDIHFDRFLEHLPMPPEMPNGTSVTHFATFGSDLSRVTWGAWGDPRGFVPKLASYFKLCNMAKSDEAILDQIGNALEPKLVGHWIGSWAGKMFTGWHIGEAHPWSAYEGMLGTHEAKYQVKQWVESAGTPAVVKFSQGIGDEAFSEFAWDVPGDTAVAQLAHIDRAFETLTGSTLPVALHGRVPHGGNPQLGLSIRIRGGKVVKVGALVPASTLADVHALGGAVGLAVDERLPRAIGPLAGETVRAAEFVRAGDHAGLDIHVDVSDTGSGKPVTPTKAVASA